MRPTSEEVAEAVTAGSLAETTGADWRAHKTLIWEADMLADKDATATVAVKDMKVAKEFYENTLGLELASTEGSEAVVYRSGGSSILVYQSKYAGTNKATAVTWSVGDGVEEVVQALKAKGVTFEHYDMPGMTRKGDVHDGGSLRVAWFKDPDSNIHAIVSG